LTVKRDGQILHEGETAVIEPGVWHDWWNAGDRDARVRVEITPGERFAHMIETLFGLARLGHTNAKGMPDPLQLALFAREFSDVIVFRRPPVPSSAQSPARSLRSRTGAAIARPTRSSHARCSCPAAHLESSDAPNNAWAGVRSNFGLAIRPNADRVARASRRGCLTVASEMSPTA
jgi:hypothetical protein